jgi:hypothetical protein
MIVLIHVRGRGETIKKYGLLPSKAELLSSSSGLESTGSDDEHESKFAHAFFSFSSGYSCR